LMCNSFFWFFKL